MRLITGLITGPSSPLERETYGPGGRANIRSLRGIEEPNEQILLRMIAEGEGGTDEALGMAWFAIRGLWDIATNAAVPVLKQAVFFRKDDIRCDALLLLRDLTAGAQERFYIELLNDRRYRLKGLVMSILGDVGGVSAIPDTVRRAKVVLRKKEHGFSSPRYELVHTVRLLARHPERSESQAFLSYLTERWDRVGRRERWAIADLLREAGILGVWDGEPVQAPLKLGEMVVRYGEGQRVIEAARRTVDDPPEGVWLGPAPLRRT